MHYPHVKLIYSHKKGVCHASIIWSTNIQGRRDRQFLQSNLISMWPGVRECVMRVIQALLGHYKYRYKISTYSTLPQVLVIGMSNALSLYDMHDALLLLMPSQSEDYHGLNLLITHTNPSRAWLGPYACAWWHWHKDNASLSFMSHPHNNLDRFKCLIAHAKFP